MSERAVSPQFEYSPDARLADFVDQLGPSTVVFADLDRASLKSDAFALVAVEALEDLLREQTDWTVQLGDIDLASIREQLSERSSPGNRLDFFSEIETYVTADALDEDARIQRVEDIAKALADTIVKDGGDLGKFFDEALGETVRAVESCGSRMVWWTAGGYLSQLVKILVVNRFLIQTGATAKQLDWAIVKTRSEDGQSVSKPDIIQRGFNDGVLNMNQLVDNPSVVAHSSDFLSLSGGEHAISHVCTFDDSVEHILPDVDSGHVTTLRVAMHARGEIRHPEYPRLADIVHAINTSQ